VRLLFYLFYVLSKTFKMGFRKAPGKARVFARYQKHLKWALEKHQGKQGFLLDIKNI